MTVARRRASSLLGALLLGFTLVLSGPQVEAVAADEAGLGAVTSVVVKLEEPGAGREAARRVGGTLARAVAPDTFVVAVEAGRADDALRAGAQDDELAWVEPDTVYRSARQVDDDCFDGCGRAPAQAELRTVRAPEAWDASTGSPEVVVAVLDTAASTRHPDLVGKVVAGPGFAPSRCLEPRAASHGTAVAGIVGARTDNGIGIASLGWDTSVLSVAVLDGCGVGRASGIALGIRYAADAGVEVINLSLTGSANRALEDAVSYAQAKGALVVAAAGNAGSGDPSFPAAYADVVAVGATAPGGRTLSEFSNRGRWVDLVAPGEDILSTSTLPGDYATYDGTSFAAPFVAAAAALLMADEPGIRPADVARRLLDSAVSLGGGAPPRLDAARLLSAGGAGYLLAAGDGGVFAFGSAPFSGSIGGSGLVEPVVGMAADPRGPGYWLAAADGGVFSFGGAPYLGSTGGKVLNQPIVGMAPDPNGPGYWLVARDGGIFAFGSARFHGSTGGRRLNQPIVGMAATSSGQGYWLVARDGGIFAFGDAAFVGSTGNRVLNQPIVGMAPTPTGRGYWLAAGDGGVFTFGDAPFVGSGAGVARTPVVGMAPAGPAGYWLATVDGEVLAFGSAPFLGAVPARPAQPVVALALRL